MDVRNNARAFILNENNEILLQKFEFKFTGVRKTLWVTPGGGLEEGESFHQALKRELFGELGLNVEIEEESILSLDITFDSEKDTFYNLRWWNLFDLQKTKEIYEPREHILRILKANEFANI